MDATISCDNVYRAMDARALVRVVHPLDNTWPMLAEYLGTRGYATAGFVANNTYCARDSGLARGFTVYQDFHLPRVDRLQNVSTRR